MARQLDGIDTALPEKDDGEFQEIAQPSWRVEFARENGKIVGVQVSGNVGGVGVFQLLTPPSGRLRHIVH